MVQVVEYVRFEQPGFTALRTLRKGIMRVGGLCRVPDGGPRVWAWETGFKVQGKPGFFFRV